MEMMLSQDVAFVVQPVFDLSQIGTASIAHQFFLHRFRAALPHSALHHPHGGDAIQVSGVWEGLQTQVTPPAAPAGSHLSEALSVP